MGYLKDVHYCAIGKEQDGGQCIEGLVPEGTKRSVYAANVALVEKMTSADSAVRKSARNALKRKYLEELRKTKPKDVEMVDFKNLLAKLGKAFQ
jgi:hypothetical protein